MNAFTKNELAIIDQALNVAVNEGSPFYAKERISLRLKIKSMIDNYCEHDWRKGAHLFNDIYCTKCATHFPVSIDDNK